MNATPGQQGCGALAKVRLPMEDKERLEVIYISYSESLSSRYCERVRLISNHSLNSSHSWYSSCKVLRTPLSRIAIAEILAVAKLNSIEVTTTAMHIRR
jgi:hypothetical protein